MANVLDSLTKGDQVNEVQFNQLACLVRGKTHRICVRVSLCESDGAFYDAPIQYARRFMNPLRVHLVQLMDVEHVRLGVCK